MVLAAPLRVVSDGFLRFSLQTGHALTSDNLRQMAVHKAEFVMIDAPDDRTEAEVAVEVAAHARRVMEIFEAADLTDPVTAALFDQVLMFRSL